MSERIVLSEEAYDAFMKKLDELPTFWPKLSALLELSKELDNESD